MKEKVNRDLLPLATPIVTIILGFVYFWLPFQLQKNNQENETFLRLIEQATTAESPEGRIAGIWMLDSYWDKDVSDDSNIHKLIANALSGILMSEENPLVRLAAAEVIGNAYEETDWNTDKNENKEKLEALKLLLYGDANTGRYGTLTSANWWLSKDCIKQAKDAKDAKAERLCQDKLFATKEAIRKNWENLENTHLGETDLSKAQLYEANLSRANLYQANLQEANLQDANLSKANLIDTDLQEANLRGANLKEALYNEKTKFPLNTQLPNDTMLKIAPESQLNNKDLSRLPLQGADLSHANLSSTNLSESNLSRANLSGANLSYANLNVTNLKDTKYNNKTKFPQGFEPEAAGMIKVKNEL